MSPLAECSRATLAAFDGVIFDVDDTLTTRGRLTARAYGALARLRDAGLGAIAVTGRPLGWADAMAATWPIDLAVGENGAGWAWRDARGLAIGHLDDGAPERIAALRAEVVAAMPHVREASDQGARRRDVAWDVGEREALPREDVDALVALIEGAGARAVVSSVHAHAAFGPYDKHRGTRAAVEATGLGADLDRWVFVGDSGNDAAAFQGFAHTVGVANVRDHLARLPVPPRWVTESDRGEGFVELVDAILEARGG